MNKEIEEDIAAITGAVNLGFYGKWDEAKAYMDTHLHHTGFLNASITLSVLAKLALELAEAEDQRVRKEYQKKINS